MNDQSLICRTCLTVLENKNFTYIDDLNGYIENVGTIREMVQFCVPEMDLYVSTYPIICHQCLPLLVTVYNFKNRCMHIETMIRAYINRNNLGDYNFVNLNCVVLDDAKIKNQVIENQIRTYMLCKDKNEAAPTVKIDKTQETNNGFMLDPKEVQTEDHLDKLLERGDPTEETQNTENLLNVERSLVVKIDRTKVNLDILANLQIKTDDPELNSTSPFLDHAMGHPDTIQNNTSAIATNVENDVALPPQMFQCKQCHFMSTNIQKVAEHTILFHNNEFLCNFCPFSCTQPDLLGKHINMVHVQPYSVGNEQPQKIERHFCDMCNYSTHNSDMLRNHRSENHISAEVNGLYRCPLCPYKSSTYYLINRHIESKHDKKNEMHCEFCPYHTRDKSNFRKHVFTHGTKPLQCQVCSYQCVSPYQMRRHVKKNHEEEKLDHFMFSGAAGRGSFMQELQTS